VYVGRSTYERTRSTFAYRELGPRSLKGHTAPVEVFLLERPRSIQDRAQGLEPQS
jgi:class 3 adenylate cyclase